MKPPADAGAPLSRAIVDGGLPLALWALHFTACYVLALVGCGETPQANGSASLRWSLGAVSAAAVAAVAALLWRAVRRACRDDAGLLATVRLAAALLALTGVVWGSVPALALASCGDESAPDRLALSSPSSLPGSRSAAGATTSASPPSP